MSDPALTFRPARARDLVTLVAMLADDPIGAARERATDPVSQAYASAFEAIDGDPNNELVVACSGDSIAGMLQLTFIPYLTYQGGWRALIEGVRVDKRHRSRGIGEALLRWAIGRARERRCRLVQLTTDKARPEALRFYLRLGFAASHEGLKLHLTSSPAADR